MDAFVPLSLILLIAIVFFMMRKRIAQYYWENGVSFRGFQGTEIKSFAEAQRRANEVVAYLFGLALFGVIVEVFTRFI